VINWIGHDIVVGSVVFRGGRQGDSSSFRVGVVDDIDESKPKPVLVNWRFEGSHRTIWFETNGSRWGRDPRNYTVIGPHKSTTSRTRYSVHDLVRLEDHRIGYLEYRDALCTAAQKLGVLKEDFAQFERDFEAGRIPVID
jgi:hypothetical protein